MIQRLEINSIHTEVDESLKKYVNKKLGGIDKYIPRQSKKSAHLEVHLKELKSSDKNNSRCEVTLFLPKQTLFIKETAINMYAAVDIVEAKLKLQLKKYKETHYGGQMRRHLMAKFLRKNTRF
ncbi:MAG TPA: ribosome-associated translation inhibitor RaiA [Patescibacteria group bacterium]|nr:ribosome-associated translation inhibitor RaiA [Patescibacteria group bacterium]